MRPSQRGTATSTRHGKLVCPRSSIIAPSSYPSFCKASSVSVVPVLMHARVKLIRIYKNEAEVGQGIADAVSAGLVDRSSLFIVGKLWNTFHKSEDVER